MGVWGSVSRWWCIKAVRQAKWTVSLSQSSVMPSGGESAWVTASNSLPAPDTCTNTMALKILWVWRLSEAVYKQKQSISVTLHFCLFGLSRTLKKSPSISERITVWSWLKKTCVWKAGTGALLTSVVRKVTYCLSWYYLMIGTRFLCQILILEMQTQHHRSLDSDWSEGVN